MKLPVRVLQVVGIMNYGGAETMIMNLYRNIDRSQVIFDFVVHGDDAGAFDQEISELGGKIYHCPKYKGYNHLTYVRWWKNFLRNHSEYKVIHGHIRSVAAIYLLIAKKYGRVTIAHSHSTSNGHGLIALIKNVMQYPIRSIADYLFACSQDAGEWLFGKKATKRDNYRIIQNGIDINKYAFDLEIREEYRRKISAENRKVYIHVGRFHPAKNHEFLLNVFKELVRLDKNAILLLLGDGPLKERIKGKIHFLNLQNNVIMLGNREDVNNWLMAADLFLFPSCWEGFPMSIIEAQASGIECLVSNTITREVAVTELVQFLPITEGVEPWIKTITSREKIRRSYKKNNKDNLEEFDMRSIAKDMQRYYEWVYNK